MFSMSALLIGCRDEQAPQIRRELLNCSMELGGEFPTLAQLANALSERPEKSYVHIVQVETDHDLHLIEQLCRRFPDNPVLALLGTDLDPLFIIQAMRSGAAQVAQLPLQPKDFVAALSQIQVTCRGSADAAGKVIAVAGVTGGVGTTTVAINLAHEIAFMRKLPCILAEVSTQMGTAAVNLGCEPRYTISDLLENADCSDLHLIEQTMTRVADNFLLLPGPVDHIVSVSHAPDVLDEIITSCRRLADAVVLDVPSTHDGQYFHTLLAADRVVLVFEQTVASVRATLLTKEFLMREGCVKNVEFLIGRFRPNDDLFSTDTLKRNLHAHRVLTIAYDRNVVAATNTGCVLRRHSPRSRALKDLATLADCLLGNSSQESKERTGVFNRLLNSFRLAGGVTQ